MNPTSTALDNEPSGVDYCVSFQFLTLPSGVYSAGFQFFLNFFLLTFVGMLYSMIILAMAQCLLPLVKKVFWAMTSGLFSYIGLQKEVREKDLLVGSLAVEIVPESGSGPGDGQDCTSQMGCLRPGEDGIRIADMSDHNGKIYNLDNFLYLF